MFHQSLQEEMYNYCVVYPPCKCRHPVQMVDTENISLLDIFQCRAGAARLMHGRWRRSLTSCNECSMLPPCRQWYARVRQRSVGNTTADSGWTCQRGSPASRLSWCTATCMVRHLNTSPIISLQPLTSLPGFVSVLRTDNNNFSYLAVDSTRTAVGLSGELNPARVVQTVLKSS